VGRRPGTPWPREARSPPDRLVYGGLGELFAHELADG
jgi:hypothetical protein